MSYDYDLFVIGGGSGGIRAARWSAKLGAKVALCESDRLGGTCVIRGCIPKKLMVYGSAFAEAFELAESYGWELPPVHLNWKKFNETRHKEIQRLEGIYQNLLSTSGVHSLSGFGVIKDSHTVEVNNKTYTSRYILIATGGKPSVLSIPGSEHTVTSNEVFSLEECPKSLLVVGSGYIGLEFASIFTALGVKTRVLFRRDYVLRGFDKDVRKALQEELIKKGIDIVPKKLPVKIEKINGQLKVTENNGGEWLGDLVLMATGRKANTEKLGLKALSIHTNKNGQIPVNEHFETTAKGIFALGDAAETPYQLTPVATAEAMILSERLFADSKKKMNYNNIPSVVFTNPPVGVVGLSEEEALAQNKEVVIYESRFRPLKLTLSKKQTKTYMKLVVCREKRTVLGCHIVGEGADEILQGFAVAVKARLTKEAFDETIGIHPTSAEELVTMRTPRKT